MKTKLLKLYSTSILKLLAILGFMTITGCHPEYGHPEYGAPYYDALYGTPSAAFEEIKPPPTEPDDE